MANSENSMSLVPKGDIGCSLPTSASKTTPPKRKILGERNVPDTYTPSTENLDLKLCKAEKRTSCELDISPDPMANYPSPRPMYLRYKPNRRKEIFLKLEKEAKEGKNTDNDLSSRFSPEVEKEEEGYGSDDESEDRDDEEEESYSCTWKELLIKSSFLFIALILCSSYIYNQNGGTQNLSLRVENFTSQGLSSFNAPQGERGDGNQMFLVLIEDESKTLDPNMPKITEVKSEVGPRNEEAEISYDLGTEESEIEHEKEILEGDQESNDGAREIMLQTVKTQLESNPEQTEDEGKTLDPDMPEIMEVKTEIGRGNEEAEISYDLGTEESETEHEKEILEGDQDSNDGVSEIMFQIVKTQLESNPKRIVGKRDAVFRPFIGVLISSLVFASLVCGLCLVKKKNSSSHASSETKTLQVESLLEDEIKGDSGFEDMCKKPCHSLTNKLPTHPLEEFDRVSYRSRVPVIELLGELDVNEVSVSSQRRNRISDGKETIYSLSLEKSQLKGNSTPVDSGFSGYSSADSSSNGRLLSDRRSINQEQNNWADGRLRKEVNATPLRRSSRIIIHSITLKLRVS